MGRRGPLRELRKRLTHRLVELAGRLLFGGLLPRLGPGSATRAGRVCARMVWHLWPRERNRTLRHLRKAYPGRPATWHAAIGRRVFENMGGCGALTAWCGLVGPGRLPGYVDISELRDWVAAHPGQAVIFVTAHMGPWILAAAEVTRLIPVEVLARPPRAEHMKPWFEKLFSGLGLAVHPQGQSLRVLRRRIRDGLSLGMVPDHDLDQVAGAFVPFYGELAYTPTGPAFLARISGARLLAAAIVPAPERGRLGGHVAYRMEVTEVPLSSTEDLNADLAENTYRWSAWLEQRIRRCPDEWGWMHRRWRTRRSKRPEAPVYRPAQAT